MILAYYDDRAGLFAVDGPRRAYLGATRADALAVARAVDDLEALDWSPCTRMPAYVAGRFTLGVWLPGGAWLRAELEPEDPT